MAGNRDSGFHVNSEASLLIIARVGAFQESFVMANNTYVVNEMVQSDEPTLTVSDDGSGQDWIVITGSYTEETNITLSWFVENGQAVSASGTYWETQPGGGLSAGRLVVNGQIENARGSETRDFIVGNELANKIYGDPTSGGVGGDDTISSAAGNDSVYGGAGNDSINGADGNDRLWGDAGNDTISGGAGLDTVHGGAGADVMSGGSEVGDTVSYAGSSARVQIVLTSGSTTIGVGGHAAGDQIYGFTDIIGSDFNDRFDDSVKSDNFSNANTWFGGSGNDRMFMGGADDTAYGGNGQDVILGEADGDALYGGGDADSLYGGAGGDSVYGGAGVDVLSGGAGRDFLSGGGQAGDTVSYADATRGVSVRLRSTTFVEQISGGGLGDTLQGFSDIVGSDYGDSLVDWGDEVRSNRMFGGLGQDYIDLSGGNDSGYGGGGVDQILGGAGNDTLYGGGGDDSLVGDAGADTLYGDGGADLFYLRAPEDSPLAGRDRVEDFVRGVDRLVIYTELADTFIGKQNFHNVAGEVRFAATAAGVVVQVDTDGVGGADMAILLVGLDTLTGADVLFL
jgi:serralysin